MELRQLRYFLAVARTMNFTRAAEEMHIAQPPLSRQISNLEDELGVRLIDREARPMRLTSSGSFFQERALEIVARIDRLKLETVSHGRGGRQTMRIGFEVSTLYGHLPAVIRHIRAMNPHLDIDLREMTTHDQVEAVRNGTIDVGVGRGLIPDPGVEQTVIRQEPLMVALSAGHPLAASPTLKLRDLEGETLIVYEEHGAGRRGGPVARLIERAGFVPAKRADIQDVLAALGLVAADAGVCIVPSVVERMRSSDVCYRPLDEPEASSPIVLSVLRGMASPIVTQIWQELDRILEKAAAA